MNQTAKTDPNLIDLTVFCCKIDKIELQQFSLQNRDLLKDRLINIYRSHSAAHTLSNDACLNYNSLRLFFSAVLMKIGFTRKLNNGVEITELKNINEHVWR